MQGLAVRARKNAHLTSSATLRITSLCIFALPPNVTLGAIQSQGQIVASHWRNLTYSVLQLYLYYTMARIWRVQSLQLSTTTQFHKWGYRRNLNLSHTASDLRAPFVIFALSDRMHLVVYRQYKCSNCQRLQRSPNMRIAHCNSWLRGHIIITMIACCEYFH